MFIPNANKEAHLGHLWICMHTLGLFHHIKYLLTVKYPGHFNVRAGILFEGHADEEYKSSYIDMFKWLGHEPDFIDQVSTSSVNRLENIYFGHPAPDLDGFRKLIYMQSVPWLVRGCDLQSDRTYIPQEKTIARAFGFRLPQMLVVPMLCKSADSYAEAVTIGVGDVHRNHLVSTYAFEDIDTFLGKFATTLLKALKIRDYLTEPLGIVDLEACKTFKTEYDAKAEDIRFDKWRFRFWTYAHIHTFCVSAHKIILDENWYSA